MMELNKFIDFKNKINSVPDRLFLIEALNEECGFFLYNNKLCFVIKNLNNADSCQNSSLITNTIDFNSNIFVKSIDNYPSFKSGNYDILLLKDDCNDNNIISFIDLCQIYTKNKSIEFSDFIHSMIEIFQLPKAQSLLDCIGLYGELNFIKYALDNNKNAAPYWHLNGMNSKYDFLFKNFGVECKTSISDSTSFIIKHYQLFNDDSKYVLLTNINESPEGTSLKELVEFCRTNAAFINDIRFQINLTKELKKNIPAELFNKKYKVKGLYCFDVSKLETISDIPFAISKISYTYTFDLNTCIGINELIDRLEK